MAVYPYSVFRIQVGWTEGEVLGGAIKCTLLVFYTLYLNSPVALDHTHYSVFASLFAHPLSILPMIAGPCVGCFESVESLLSFAHLNF